MSLKDLGPKIRFEYATTYGDVLNDFYIPCLKQTKYYDRAVGFFSTSILLHITDGLASLYKNGGKMRLIVSPKLSEDDYKAIQNGYDLKQFVTDTINNSFDELIEFDQKNDRFGLLSYMIASGLLEVRIAVLEKDFDKNMFHEKNGIMTDSEGNVISFTGSANETENGWINNGENIDVYCSWKSQESEERCALKSMRFNRMWDSEEKGMVVIPFPEVVKEKLIKYIPKNIDDVLKIDDSVLEKIKKQKELQKQYENVPTLKFLKNKNRDLFKYQYDAISKWKEKSYRGIYDMATGTGKTYTACGSIVELFEAKKRLFVVICVPFIHLAEQWAEEVREFNIIPIVCYGGQKYEKNLERQANKFKQKRTNFVCCIVVNATFSRNEFVSNIIEINLKETLLIVDEAHNFGADNLSEKLKDDYPYRLALSATLDRANDEIGTQRLYSFFGEKCIEYSLKKAIEEGKLTSYIYHPVLVTLTSDELDEYTKLTVEIKKRSVFADMDDQKLKTLLLQRARLVAGADNKLKTLYKILEEYKNERNMLIYCGAVKYGEKGYDKNKIEESQIKEVVKHLSKMGIASHKFTSEESRSERLEILNSFKSENGLQAIVAIKCLDEGMNVPAIRTAFILASSTNPKEYVQRRGRVLRKYPGKKYAEIYDFVTVPRPLDTASHISDDEKKIDLSLINREFSRLEDFAESAINSSESNTIINDIRNSYDLFTIKENEEI